MIDKTQIPAKFISFQARWAERNARMDTIIEAVNGNWNVDGPDDDQIENRSPNMIQIALEDTAEASSIIPTVRVSPSGSATEAKHQAVAMERMAIGYLDASQIELLTIKSFMDLGAHGMFSWLVIDDPETGGPLFQWRDPRTCFPEPGWKTMDSVRECFFARDLYVSQLKPEWQDLINNEWPNDSPMSGMRSIASYIARKVVLIEYFTEEEWFIGGLYQSATSSALAGGPTYSVVEFERGLNTRKICPVVVGQRMTLDNEPRGQYDQVVDLMRAHIRLMGMVLDYADQAVYSDIFVTDLIGSLSVGGGSYIQLGPNGKIGRVPPATSDISVFREMETLIDSMHLGGRWPKTRPGEIDQAIASGKFVEATVGIMNTVIKTNHLIMKRAWEQALRVGFAIDKERGRNRTISGILRNQQFMIDRDANDIDLAAKVRVDYGLGLGREPAQAMVLGIQLSQAGIVSHEFVQENFDGITDVEKERARIDTERFRDMALAQLLEGLQQGTIPREVLPKIAKARLDGEDIFELFDKFIVKPEQEKMEQMPTSGLAGGPVQPGVPPAAGAPAPNAPPPEDILGALGIGGGGPPESAARLNVPLGNGGFAGTTSTMGGPGQ